MDTYICCNSIFKNAATNIKFRTVGNLWGGRWMEPEEVGESFKYICNSWLLLNKDIYVHTHSPHIRNVMLWERWMMTTQMILMLFSAFFCLNYFLINQNVRTHNKTLPSTETVSDLSKCEQEVQTGRYTVGRWGRPGESENIVSIKKKPMGWDRSFTPEDQETAGSEGGGGGKGMVFAPMQTGAETGSDSARGRRVTDNFSPQTPAPLRPLTCLGASSQAGQARADRGSRSPPVCSAAARWAAGGRGGALADWPGAGKETTRASDGQGARGRERKRGPGRPPQTTSLSFVPNRRPPPLTQTSLSSLPASSSPPSIFRSGVKFLLFPCPPVHFALVACSSLARSLSHLLRPRHPTE